MNRSLDALKAGMFGSAICVLLALVFATMEIALDVHKLTPKAAAALDSVQAIAKSTSDVEQATYASEGEISNLADTLNGIAVGLANHEDAELKQTHDAALKLSALLDSADLVVLGLGQTEQATTSAINGIASDSHATFGAAQDAINDAATQVSNPAIADSLESIRASAASVKDATEQISATSKEMTAAATDARQIADHWRAATLAPVSTVKKIGLAVAAFAGVFAAHFF